jgi:outer membrane protein TolC
VLQTVKERVGEGRALPIEADRAALSSARARQRVEALHADADYLEASLAMILGQGPDDRVRPAGEDRPVPEIPDSEEAGVAGALNDNIEIRTLESSLLAKSYDIQAAKASRWPRMDLVAQYGLFAKFNNYEDFFQRFQRHNGQLGVSFQVPLYTGPGPKAAAAQAEADTAKLRVQMASTRSRISVETRRGFQEVRKAQTARDVARLDLDVARQQTTVFLAQLEEGRIGASQVEQARFEENEKWIEFFDAQYALEKARYALLRQTGDLVAALE